MRNDESGVKSGRSISEGRDAGETTAAPTIKADVLGGEESTAGDRDPDLMQMDFYGGDAPHGPEPHLEPPAGYPAFNPNYLCVLFIDFKPDWTLSINHASYDFQPDQNPTISEASRLVKAIAVIDGKIRSGGPLAEVSGHLPYAWKYSALHQQGKTHDSTTFKDFKFRRATEIFLFLNKPSIVLGSRAELFRFTRFGGTALATGMDANHSFFRAREVTGSQLGVLNNQGKLIRLENHARIDALTSTDAREQNYSLNIRLGIDGGAAGIIPIILDPDTGNGQGNEP